MVNSYRRSAVRWRSSPSRPVTRPKRRRLSKATVSAKTVVVTPRSCSTANARGDRHGNASHGPQFFASLSAPSREAGRTGARHHGPKAVRVGEPLIELDQAPFAASLQAAEAAFAAAEQANERQQRLAKEGVVPRKDAEQAAADLARARNDLTQARRAESLSIIKSPINGIVTRMSATLGARRSIRRSRLSK